MKKITTLMLTLLVSYCGSHAQQLAAWTDAPAQGGWATQWAPTTTAANVTVSAFTRGSGLGSSGTAAGGAWGASGGWAASPTAAGTSGSLYFTIKANSGHRISISSIPTFYTRRSNAGPGSAAVLYSLDGGASYTSITSVSTTATSGTGANSSNNTLTNLTSIAALQNVPSTTTITFKIVPAAGNNWYIMASGGGFVLNGATSVVLPVTLKSFTAKRDEERALLYWETAMEQNVSHFEVENSTDGQSFSVIARVNALNKPAGDRYRYADGFVTGKQYYRLKSVDRDGTYSYSPVAMLQATAAEQESSLLQNPVTTQLRLSLKAEARYTIVDLGGRQQQHGRLEAGGTGATLDVAALPPGIYIIRLQTAAGITSHKFIKE